MPSMKESCRVCLMAKGNDEFIDVNIIFEDETILQIITNCAPIELLENDPLPQVVCINCVEKLQSFHKLRQLILKSDITFKKRLPQFKELSCKYEFVQKREFTTNHDSKGFELCNSENNCEKENPPDENKMEVQDKLLQPKDLRNFDNKLMLNFTDGDKDDLKKSMNSCNKPNATKGENKSKKKLKKPLKKIKIIHECKECNKIFKKADHYTVHMTKHTGEKKYACEFCPKRFARSYVLVYHRRVHTGERPYTCKICSKSFSSPSNFYNHKKIHTGEKNYKCEMCSESFIQSDSLKIHIRRIHTGERPFLCEICSSAFRSNSSLLTHKIDMHGKKEACPICDKLYSSRVLKEHIRRHKEREEGIKRFVCDQCGKRFTCSSSRKKHLLIHSGEKPFSCRICEKSFNQRSSLKTHMRIHSDFMPFPCDHCSKSFRYKHHLRSHVNTHHKDVVKEAEINNY